MSFDIIIMLVRELFILIYYYWIIIVLVRTALQKWNFCYVSAHLPVVPLSLTKNHSKIATKKNPGKIDDTLVLDMESFCIFL